MKVGIVLQGNITDWTKDIIDTYRKELPDCEIILSTWEAQETTNISNCIILKLPMPAITGSNINFQKYGSLAGIVESNADVILKCRTDQYIDAKHMFEVFKKVDPSKILISNYATIESIDYFAADFCQIACKNILLDYWNSIIDHRPGVIVHHPEQYLTKCYIDSKKVSVSWNTALHKYYHVCNFITEWKIKWKKLESDDGYKNTFNQWYPKCIK
jgi:hypothetical protein